MATLVAIGRRAGKSAMNIRTDAGTTVSKIGGRRPKRIIIAVLIIVALGGVVWFAIHLGKTSKPARRGFRPSTTVGVATAKLANIPITLDALGTVVPAAKVTVTPQVSGVITQILFKEGQMVKKGEALAVIDPRPLQNALMQAQGQLTQAQAQLADAQLLLQRDQALLAQDSIARQVVDTQAATVKQLQGVVTTDQAAVGAARLNLGFSRVVSPVAGRVGLRVVDIGNYIGAGTATGIVVVTQVTPIDVEFTVPQDEIPRIMDQAKQSKLPVTALDRTRTITLDKGLFSTLDNQVDSTTGTVRAKARFDNAEGALFPNQFVNVEMNLQPLANVVTVPVTAIRSGPGGDFVWVLQQDKTVTMRNVQRGPGTATDVSITKGLRPCEQVITEGGDRLTEGARVTLPGENPQAAGPGGARNGQRRRRPGGAQGGQGVPTAGAPQGAGRNGAGGQQRAANGAAASGACAVASQGGQRGRAGGAGQANGGSPNSPASAPAGDNQGVQAQGGQNQSGQNQGGPGQGAQGFQGSGRRGQNGAAGGQAAGQGGFRGQGGGARGGGAAGGGASGASAAGGVASGAGAGG
jgi:multidrug efflux system membrane fusion protein